MIKPTDGQNGISSDEPINSAGHNVNLKLEVTIEATSSSANLVENEATVVTNELDLINNIKQLDKIIREQTSETAASKNKGTSNIETLMHIIKANIGTGVLAMPLAFNSGGLIWSSIWIWIMAFICIHCMHILLDCYKYCLINSLKKNSDKKKSSESIGYSDVVFMIAKDRCAVDSNWPKITKTLVSVFLVIGQLGFCCVYIVFVPKNIQQVIDAYYPPPNGFSVESLMTIVLGPLALFCLIKSLKILAPFSTFANFLMIFSMFVILYELLFDGALKPMSELKMIAPIADWPVYFSTAIYAFEGISLVLPVYHEMRNKSDFTPWNGVLNMGMILVAVMYFSIGFFGYLKYGVDSQASITLNLPTNNLLFQIIKILFAVAIFISYNLQFYVAADIIWSAIFRSSRYLQSIQQGNRLIDSTSSQRERRQNLLGKFYMLYENSFRIGLVVFTFALAINVPRIDLFISLVGSIASSTLAIIIPPIMDHVVFFEASKRSKLRLVKNILIILFGLYIFTTGTYVSIRDIVDYLKNK